MSRQFDYDIIILKAPPGKSLSTSRVTHEICDMSESMLGTPSLVHYSSEVEMLSHAYFAPNTSDSI